MAGTSERGGIVEDGSIEGGSAEGRAALDLTRSAVDLAPRLLGALLTTRVEGEVVTVRVVEVEAYEGADDPASHAYRGLSARNAAMFGPPGHLYVYRHLGLHHCANVVVGEPGRAAAVLLRAGEVTEGVEVAWRRRRASGVCRAPRDLARGPARLAVALGLRREHDGVPIRMGEADDAGLSARRPGDGGDLVELRLATTAAGATQAGPRVGIGGAGEDAAGRPWRWWTRGDAHVSASR